MGWLSELVEERGAEALDLHAQTVNPQFVQLLRTIGFDRRWARARGAHLWDDEGNRYLDLLGGFGMFNIGRNNPHVREALVEALELERPGSVQLGVDVLPALLAEELLRRAPASVERALFTSSGAEAVEAALKLGRAATRRARVLTAKHAFHGLTLGALSATASPEFSSRFGPLLPGFENVPWNDLAALERELAQEDVALFLVEAVQGKGINLPADNYLQRAQELCRRYGTLFGVDEVQTGLGRTGRMFALEHWGLEPDLITVAKSLSGGYVPVGALLMSAQVYDGVFDSLPNAVSHGSTFAPNDLAMVAGLATLRELDEQGLVERSARLGEALLERTRALADSSPVVREVRGLGLMWAIEFEEPEGGSRPWKLLERIQPGLFSQLVVVPLFRDHRVLSQVAGDGLNVLKALPPLVLDEDDLDWFVSSLEETVGRAEKMPRALVRFALQAARAGRGPRRRLARALAWDTANAGDCGRREAKNDDRSDYRQGGAADRGRDPVLHRCRPWRRRPFAQDADRLGRWTRADRGRPADRAGREDELARQPRLELGHVGVALGDAGARPALRRLDQPPAEHVQLALVVGQVLGRDLDAHLVQRRLALGTDLVALLGHDRDLSDLR